MLKYNIGRASFGREFSVSETAMGEWVNGKPIYCKVVSLKKGKYSTWTLDLNTLNIDELIKFHIVGVDGDTNSWMTFPYYLNSYSYSTVEIKDNQFKIGIDREIKKGFLILTYTKK